MQANNCQSIRVEKPYRDVSKTLRYPSTTSGEDAAASCTGKWFDEVMIEVFAAMAANG